MGGGEGRVKRDSLNRRSVPVMTVAVVVGNDMDGYILGGVMNQ